MANYALKVKSKMGQEVIKELMPSSTIDELRSKLSKAANIPIEKLHVLAGYPPKILDLTDKTATLSSRGLASGETLIVEEVTAAAAAVAVAAAAAVTVANVENDSAVAHQYSCPGILMKQVVPADNSCLFTSIGFVLNGKVDTSIAPQLRQVIAEAVARDPTNYSEGILGKSNKDYCDWILKSESWGGAIELAVLSEHFGIEMDVVDTINAIIQRFGEDKMYGQRVLLLFDGIHYDPLFLESLEGGSIQTIFPVEDEWVLKEAEQLAQEAKSSRQFTDVDKFTIRCLVCDKLLTGQTQAQQHAKATGHTNFGEV